MSSIRTYNFNRYYCINCNSILYRLSGTKIPAQVAIIIICNPETDLNIKDKDIWHNLEHVALQFKQMTLENKLNPKHYYSAIIYKDHTGELRKYVKDTAGFRNLFYNIVHGESPKGKVEIHFRNIQFWFKFKSDSK